MPIKETLRERLREESIWIMLVIFFGFVTIWSTIRLVDEMNHRFNGKKVEATCNEKFTHATFETDNGEKVTISLANTIFDEKDHKIIMYYFEGKEEEAIVLTSWKWWIIVFGLTLTLTVWGGVMLYKNFRKRKIVRQKFGYEKRQVSYEEMGAIISSEFAVHNKGLYEKHEVNRKAETIVYRKEFDAEKEKAMAVIEEQEKIWKIGTVYLGVVLGEKLLINGVRQVVYTDSPKFLKDPESFLEKATDIKACEEALDIHISNTIVEIEKLPFSGTKNQFYLVLAKPGLCENAILLPEWYYLKEEIEVM